MCIRKESAKVSRFLADVSGKDFKYPAGLYVPSIPPRYLRSNRNISSSWKPTTTQKRFVSSPT